MLDDAGNWGNNMRMQLYTALAVTGLLCSCGTITRGSSEAVNISAYPANAKITTSIGQQCPMSPCKLTVERKVTFTAYAEAPGYHPGSIQIETKVAGAGAAGMAGNVLLGGVIGAGVDAYSGAAYNHVPNPAMIVLQPINPKDPATPAMSAPPAKVEKPAKAGVPVS